MPWRVASEAACGDTLPFVGRRKEIARFSEKLGRASTGEGGLVMLIGEPGIGKTQLADVFGDKAHKDGWIVLRGRCYEGESALPYGPFSEALGEFACRSDPGYLRTCLGYGAPPIARLVPILREILPDIADPATLRPEEERSRLLDAVSQLLVAISQSEPVLLVLDDLHWADKGTIAMLRHVARAASRSRLLLLGTYRDVDVDEQHPLSNALDELHRETAYDPIVLTGLDTEEVGSLISVVAGPDVPARVADLIRAETSGNPFFIRQLLLHFSESGLLHSNDGRLTLTTESIRAAGIPDGIRWMMRRRLSRLSDKANRLLSVACGFSSAFSLAITAGVAGLNDDEALDAADEALSAQLLRPGVDSDCYEFVHALVRHAIYEEMNPSRRIRLHRSIAEGLEQSPEPFAHAAELAHQYGRSASLPGADRGVRYALAAAERAESAYAFDDVATFLRIAVNVLLADAGRRPRLVARLALALACALDLEEAAKVAAEAGSLIAASEGDAPAADYLAQAAQSIAWSGDHVGAWRLAELGLRHIGERRDKTWAVLTRYDIARREAEDPDNPGMPLDSPERREIARIFLREQVDRHPELAYVSRQEVLQFAQDQPGALATFAGEYRQAIQVYRARIRRYEREGRVGELAFTFAGLSRSNTALGNFQEAEAAYEKAVQFAARLPEGSNQDLQPLAALWELRLARDPDNPDSVAQIRALLQQAYAQHQFAFAPMRAATSLVYAFLGESDEAISWLETVIDPIERAPAWATNYTALVCVAAWSLWMTGRTDHVDVIERNLIEKTLAADFRYPMHDARLCLGRVCALQGRYREATDWFAQAREVTEEQGARPVRAIIDYDEGLMYLRRRRKGDRGRAVVLLKAARTQFQDIGMTGWVPRAEQLLRTAGEEGGSQSVLPGGVTSREAEVLRLIAAGRTTSEIASDLRLSVRTVARHVTHIYEKIAARNRAEATAYANRHQLH